MGGPLHSAALKTLDIFRANGLYTGARRGNLLGTAFYSDSKMSYHHRTSSSDEGACSVRNGFWPEVVARVNPKISHTQSSSPEDPPWQKGGRHRATQTIYHLQLRDATSEPRSSLLPSVTIKEDSVTISALISVVISEISAIGLALFVGLYENVIWLAVYLCVPVMLKICAMIFSLQRDPIQKPAEDGSTEIQFFEVDCHDQNFIIISGPDAVVRQFFRHYGHPIRDRWKEIVSMFLIYVFVLYFPAGLVALLWMEQELQYVWLGYQIYTIVVMHIVRTVGEAGVGRTEERVAKLFRKQRDVYLTSSNGGIVAASLKWTFVDNVKEGRLKSEEIWRTHRRVRI